jgi:ubiquinone/menaquinone biosynthesis C-methylase UbiE
MVSMTERTTGAATSESCAYKYLRLSSDAAKEVRATVLGSAVANGYTTVNQADRLGKLLRVRPGSRLLDVGSGRGWPGGRIAERTGCDVVSADLPLLALRDARIHGARSEGASAVVCADGRGLPFRDACFDATSHADVLC